jgi:serine/threonine-protein kinase
MPGWCNGSAGFVFLWTLAYSSTCDERFADLAESAAWNTWEDSTTLPDLCCGLTGRAYALLNFYRFSGKKVWLDRALTLGSRAASSYAGNGQGEERLSLFGGEVGTAVLLADLKHPEEAFMPLFEGAYTA